jgi:hypothetical protein
MVLPPMTTLRCALLPAALLAATLEAQSPAAPLRGVEMRTALLEEVQPVALENCDLKRFGGPADGGYLLCENLSDGIESAYSYGIGHDDSFGCDVSKRYGVPVHQYDCFDLSRPTCEGGVFVFHPECIGPRREQVEGRPFDTLENQIERNGDRGKRLVAKIDIEGAEWESLLAAPDSVLERIDQMPMELHLVQDDPRYLELVRRLAQRFYPVDLHFNNHACAGHSHPLPAWAFQVLWVNKRLGVLDRSAPRPAPTSPLQAPDNPTASDCQLPAAVEP